MFSSQIILTEEAVFTMTFVNIQNKIRRCLTKLFSENSILFERNGGKGLCERCLVFRFAMYLQNEFSDYYVDCDFNNSCSFTYNSSGEYITEHDRSGKIIANPDRTRTKRFVDIIVHKRTFQPGNDFICFEIKKWNNCRSLQVAKDKNNLCRLTSVYGYRYGFYLVLGKTLAGTQWEVYRNGDILHELNPCVTSVGSATEPENSLDST